MWQEQECRTVSTVCACVRVRVRGNGKSTGRHERAIWNGRTNADVGGQLSLLGSQLATKAGRGGLLGQALDVDAIVLTLDLGLGARVTRNSVHGVEVLVVAVLVVGVIVCIWVMVAE